MASPICLAQVSVGVMLSVANDENFLRQREIARQWYRSVRSNASKFAL